MAPLMGSFLERRRSAMIIPHLRGDILDLGCGLAGLARYVQPGQVYTGVDLNPQIVAYMQDRFPQFQYLVCDLDRQTPALERRYDTVVMLAVLEHLAQPDGLMEFVCASLKPGGRLILTTPTPIGNRIHAVGAHLGLFYLEAAHDHKLIYNRASLQALLERHALHMLEYHSFLLGGNQMCLAAAVTGG